MNTHNPSRKMATKSLILISVVSSAMMTGTAMAQGAESTTDLAFQTRGQSLFADVGNVTKTESLRFDILNEQNEMQRGRVENSQVPLSVATLQVIWQRAVDTCTSQSFTMPVVGTRFSPSEGECINGEVRRNYCVVPPKLGWNSCPDIGGNRKTYVRDLGMGIGPKPTKPTKRAYDFGAIVTMNSDVRVGFEGSYSYDLGSVDIDYAAQARLAIDKESAEPGELVTISTSYVDQDPYLMTSRYPSFELALDMYAYAAMEINAQYAGVNESNGNQVRSTKQLYSVDSRENPDAIDGFMPFTNGSERLFGVRLDNSGYTTTVLGDETTTEARYDYNLTYPWSAPEKPAKKAPRYKFPVSFSVADFAFTVPQLDTPAAPGFLCGDCVPYRNDIVSDELTNSTPVGRRQLIGGITDGNGIVLPFVNEGEQDVDLVRVDVDLDVVTVAAGVPLGIVIQDPVGVLSVELNLLDLDLATFISADQTLSFRPNLEVDLRFSAPIEVRRAGEADFRTVSAITITVGDSLEFNQPDNGVIITPVYTVRNNEFTNDTQLKISNAIQETLGQVKLGGYVGEHLAEVMGEDPNFALLQITPTLYEPAKIWGTSTNPWSLNEFNEVPGLPVSIGIAPGVGPGVGPGPSPAPGPGPGPGPVTGGSGGGSGGGGATAWISLLGLLCAFSISLRGRRFVTSRNADENSF